MKSIIYLVAACVLCSAAVQSQTELWRVDGSYMVAAQDGQGNTYVSQKYPPAFGGLDTLMKVGPDGTVLWKTATPAYGHRVLLSQSGIYLSPAIYSGDPLYFYDLNGIFQWSFAFPERSYFRNYPAVGQDGSIILTYSTAPPPVGSTAFEPLASTLVKINVAGGIVFQVDIPIVTPNAYQQYMLGPVLTDDGNIWVLAQGRNATEKFFKAAHTYKEIGVDEALLYNGTNGQLMLRKNVFQGKVEEWKDNANGSSKSFILNNGSFGGPATFVAVSGTSFVVGGFWDAQTENCLKTGNCSYTGKSEWRMSIVPVAGKVTNFRYRGKGERRSGSGPSAVKTDESSNVLRDILVGPNGNLYLHGEVARGKVVDDVGEMFLDDVLINYNIAARTSPWKIVTAGSGFVRTTIHPASQVLLRQKDALTLDVVNLSGAAGGTPLAFTNEVYLWSRQEGTEYYFDYTEPGTVLLYGRDDASAPNKMFLGKYSIAAALSSQRFTPMATQGDLLTPGSFALSQNYPNPFNPTTTIEFELPVDASVSVKVYNSLGQEAAVLVDREEFAAGTNQLEFDADDLPSGVYYYRITAAGLGDGGRHFSEMKKMVFVK